MRIGTDDWTTAFQRKGSLCLHDANPKRPHTLLESGLHSTGFFDSSLVISDEQLLAEAARNLLFQAACMEIQIGCVVGPYPRATKLAQVIADEIMSLGRLCYNLSPAKRENHTVKSMVFADDELRIFAGGTSVLLCNDDIVTGESLNLAADAVIAAGGKVLPYVVTLVNFSGLMEVDGRKILTLIDWHRITWTSEECALCKIGSEAIDPTKEGNLARLNAAY